MPKDKNKTGYVIEIKIAKLEENLEAKAEEAIKQIEQKRYITELISRGIKSIIILGLAFRGKNVFILDRNITL